MNATFMVSRSTTGAVVALWKSITRDCRLFEFPEAFQQLVKRCYLIQVNDLANLVIFTESSRGNVRALLDLSESLLEIDCNYETIDNLTLEQLSKAGNVLARSMLGMTAPYCRANDYVDAHVIAYGIGSILPTIESFKEIEESLVTDLTRLGLTGADCQLSFHLDLRSIKAYGLDVQDLK